MNGKRVIFNVGGNKIKILCEYHGRILRVIGKRSKTFKVRLITAYDADDKEKKLYRERAQW